MVVNRVETGEERSETVERVDEERRHLAEVRLSSLLLFPSLLSSRASRVVKTECIRLVCDFVRQACIVRILKSAKTMSHIELMNEVTRQLAGRFQPTPSMIKKRIEALIDVSLTFSLSSSPAAFVLHSRRVADLLLPLLSESTSNEDQT